MRRLPAKLPANGGLGKTRAILARDSASTLAVLAEGRLAGHRKAPVAEHPLAGKARNHPRGTSGHHGTGEEPGVAGVLRAALAAWRCAIGRRYVARGRRRLVAARHFLFSKK